MYLKLTWLCLIVFGVSLPVAAHTWKQDLERFPLERLSLYSIEIRSSGKTATILDPDGYLHTVKEVDSIGKTTAGYTYVACIIPTQLILGVVLPDPNPPQDEAGPQFVERYLTWIPQQQPAPITQQRLPKGCDPNRDTSK